MLYFCGWLQKYSSGFGFHGARSVISNDLASENACIPFLDSGLGIVRSYLTSIRGGKKIIDSSYFSECNKAFANPRLRRLFCSEPPKKRSKRNHRVFERILVLFFRYFLFFIGGVCSASCRVRVNICSLQMLFCRL